MSDLCYLCGRPGANKPLALKDTFTAHSSAMAPDSASMCDRCEYALNLRCWYWNEKKPHPKNCKCEDGSHTGMWVILFGRVWSWLISEKESWPLFGESIERWPNAPIPGKEKQRQVLQHVYSLPTRIQMRQWLTEPPEPPFEIVIAESGQKHLLPFSRQAHNRDRFPVMFEEDQLIIDRESFTDLLLRFESLMNQGFSKTEIMTGQYRSDRLIKTGLSPEWMNAENFIMVYRGSRLLELVNHVAQSEKTLCL